MAANHQDRVTEVCISCNLAPIAEFCLRCRSLRWPTGVAHAHWRNLLALLAALSWRNFDGLEYVPGAFRCDCFSQHHQNVDGYK